AAGVVFTVPALIFLSGGEQYFKYVTIFTLAAIGGILGVLFMVPLRRALIVKEHGDLPYPEGTACADVLLAGERGGDLAQMVLAFKESLRSFGAGAGEAKPARTDQELGMGLVIGGSLVLALVIAFLPGFPHGPVPGSLLMSLLVVVFGFFFVTVASRIVGII